MGIYSIRNKLSNKMYIGQTRDLSNRKKVHLHNLRINQHINTHLQNSFNLYGEENFEFKVIKECEESELDYYEDYYINKYDTKDNGYNLCDGGLNNCPDNSNEKHGMWRHDIDNELVRRMYLSGKKSGEIAKIFHCGRRTIDRRLHKIFDDKTIKDISNKRRRNSLTGKRYPKGRDHPLYAKDVPEGDVLYKECLEGNTQWDLARKYNVTQTTISDRICRYKETLDLPNIRRNLRDNGKLWDNAVVGYHKTDMRRQGFNNPCHCFFLRLNGGYFTYITSMEWFSLELIADLVEEFIE